MSVVEEGLRQTTNYTYYVQAIMQDGKATGTFLIALYETVKPCPLAGYLDRARSGGLKIVYVVPKELIWSDAGDAARFLRDQALKDLP